MQTTQAFAKAPNDENLSKATRAFLSQGGFGHVINGESVASVSGETFAVYDPATGKEFTRCAAGGVEDVDRAVRAARRAFDDGRWRNLEPLEKERRLRRLGQLI